MPMPKDTPAVFDKILADYRHGTIDQPEVQTRIADAIKADSALQAFKDQHLAWTDYDDAVEWI
ncbi:hypothetical protein SM11_chr2332 [Sinorhizobium meliloti SM11]|uniref:Uncharacterized protein n=1 Tax=Sinorhizobium meliloti (strain SM11) TaxID=707241 RepID=F7X3I9_SINMM|nr:hypothetical protein [Sinorhizobium meliloti]AEH79586.1 hypothetical protein SM11_chr2332 [Sinorhizobium meliloti SM11]MDE4557559.1 hypothetical protein [Sinorhizobium meliloti SM11]